MRFGSGPYNEHHETQILSEVILVIVHFLQHPTSSIPKTMVKPV